MSASRPARGGLALAVLVLALPACAGAAAPAGGAADASALAPRARVEALVGAAACNTDADCRTMAIGAKACGGPEAYIAWSVRTTDEALLAGSVAAYNAAQKTAITREGRVSNCALVTDPGAVCVASGVSAGSCQLRPHPGRQGPASSR